MTKNFQVLFKGIGTNKLYLFETESYKEYKQALENVKNNSSLILITVNTFSY